MNIFNDLLPFWLNLVLIGLALGGLVIGGRFANWRFFLSNTGQHVFLGSIVIVAFFWELEISIRAGLALHLLGATLITRLLGGGLSLFALTIVLIFHTIYHEQYQSAIALNQLILVAWPVLVASCTQLIQDKWLPKNLFIYLLGGGFLTAAISFASSGLLAVIALGSLGAYSFDYLLTEFLPYWLLLSWAEAFQTGFLLTLMVIYKPEWVSTFVDTKYFGPKRSIWKDKP
ncbi:energy-coupling factor ABC transporter permease [Leeia sp. TBRC 13508]|uniref:Energy-coupling factor ABC transporter permease n=1 Tax=Leeia speluncae TaxID=2884804 RepID=A0ABS8D875_9NEIS|nr:energy-coupling factor ABC transporter permease [Leeia speluncae]MCB6184395.1 energy-coupling factor ABC transporter permease [Leeia speluncae]